MLTQFLLLFFNLVKNRRISVGKKIWKIKKNANKTKPVFYIRGKRGTFSSAWEKLISLTTIFFNTVAMNEGERVLWLLTLLWNVVCIYF